MIVLKIIAVIAINLVTAEFAVRVIRFAITGKGGVNEPFAWWKKEYVGKHIKEEERNV